VEEGAAREGRDQPGLAGQRPRRRLGRRSERDGRVEIAVRDFLTPAAGESLSIFRQKSDDALKFKPLQSIGGDRVTVQEKSGKPDTIERLIKSNHSTDGRTHHEVWKWKDKRDRWVCKVDCMPRA
jgi:hypothetical protein